jgi:hypothetical protein
MTWLFDQLRRLPCVFQGHDSVLHFESDRISLRCLSCGYRSPGWRLGPDVGYTSSPVHELSPQPATDLARPLVILDKKAGSAFAAHVSRADGFDEASAAKGPRALGDDRKSRVMRLAS